MNFYKVTQEVKEFCQQFFSTVVSAGKSGSSHMIRTRSADGFKHSVKPPCKLSLGHFRDQGFFMGIYSEFISLGEIRCL